MHLNMSPIESKSICFPDKIRIIFASQTGQAESISEFIYDHFVNGELKIIKEKFGDDSITRICVSDYNRLIEDFLEPKSKHKLRPGSYLAIVVASTTGQGDPPDKALKFFRWIRRLKRSGSNNHLPHLSYALLGLGDTNYDNFANFAKQLDKFFLELGATPYVPSGKFISEIFKTVLFYFLFISAFADDAVGLEIVTEPFIDNLVSTILKQFKEATGLSTETVTQSVSNSVVTNHTSVTNGEHMCSESKMNLDRPVVSSCNYLTSSDKCFLSDICRQLIEPSLQFSDVADEDLIIPKLSAKMLIDDFILFSKTDDTPKDEPFNEVSIFQILQGKLSKDIPLFEGEISLSRKLCMFPFGLFDSLFNLIFLYFLIISYIASVIQPSKCCHKEKIVLECDVKYSYPADREVFYQFAHGDAFGIYSSNLLIDVCQVLLSVKYQISKKDDEWTLLWDYFKCNKKIFVKLNDNVSLVFKFLLSIGFYLFCFLLC